MTCKTAPLCPPDGCERHDCCVDRPEGPDGRPDCGYCAERLAVNVGLLTENTELKRKLAGREPATVQVTNETVERAARALYEQGYGYDIDADEVARNSMLSVARHTLAAALSPIQKGEN